MNLTESEQALLGMLELVERARGNFHRPPTEADYQQQVNRARSILLARHPHLRTAPWYGPLFE